MNWAKIRKEDVANGPGIRVSIWIQGCNRRCLNCFNPETWDATKGHILGPKVLKQFLDFGDNDNVVGYSILGGEPLLFPNEMLQLVRAIKERHPDKTIWMWTGFTYESLNDDQLKVLHYIDYLVDGAFIEDLKNPDLAFRGSSNQRILKINHSEDSITDESNYFDNYNTTY